MGAAMDTAQGENPPPISITDGDLNPSRAAEESSGARGELHSDPSPDGDDLIEQLSDALEQRERDVARIESRVGLETVVKQRTEAMWNAVLEFERAQQELRESEKRWVLRKLKDAGLKGDETPNHIERTSRYCEVLARVALGDSERAAAIALASRLHDIGMSGIPDEILLRAGRLNDEDLATMRDHTVIGYELLIAETSDIARVAATIGLSHHERWDGTGYPHGLSGHDIPVEARIVAIADTFDALTTDRLYRKAFTVPDALDVMHQVTGTQFDPDLAGHFMRALDEILEIHRSIV